MSRVETTSASQLQLPLPNESPMVGTTVYLYVRHYRNRTLLQDNSLILRNLTSADSGTFLVREKGSSRTRDVVILHIFSVG
ncbi:hypothetical protein M9458_033902, partial [Cirrhinus mrigala]